MSRNRSSFAPAVMGYGGHKKLLEEIRQAEQALLELQARAVVLLEMEHAHLREDAKRIFGIHQDNSEQLALERFQALETGFWIAKGKRDIQAGVMALQRALTR